MRRSLRQLLIVLALPVLALLFTPKTTAAQGGTIRGRIADSTGVPIAQAVIVLDPGGLRATSRENGDYVISRVPSGSYTVRVRRLGYVTPTATVTVADGQTVRQDFLVNHAAISLTDVVIGSRARHTAAEELAVPVDVYTPEQIHSQGTTETSQILSQLSPSVNFPRQSVSDATEIVRPFTMRGLEPRSHAGAPEWQAPPSHRAHPLLRRWSRRRVERCRHERDPSRRNRPDRDSA